MRHYFGLCEIKHAMKILHTSDLHLGHTFHSYDRTREQSECLSQIESIIRKRQPDAYIISGDVYHTTSPQTSAQEMLMRHLLNAHEAAPSMKIIVTAGNHDSSRIEITDPLWNLVGVSMVGSIKRDILGGATFSISETPDTSWPFPTAIRPTSLPCRPASRAKRG